MAVLAMVMLLLLVLELVMAVLTSMVLVLALLLAAVLLETNSIVGTGDVEVTDVGAEVVIGAGGGVNVFNW